MHFAKLTGFFFKTYNRCLVSFSNFVMVLITGYDDFALSNSLGNHSRDSEIRLLLCSCPILTITRTAV